MPTSRPPSYGTNNNQNYFVTLGRNAAAGGKQQPPGGTSSISLGWDDTTKPSSSSSIAENHKTNANQSNVSNNVFANGTNMNCGNVITERPSSRVLNPPGGKSTITFG